VWKLNWQSDVLFLWLKVVCGASCSVCYKS